MILNIIEKLYELFMPCVREGKMLVYYGFILPMVLSEHDISRKMDERNTKYFFVYPTVTQELETQGSNLIKVTKRKIIIIRAIRCTLHLNEIIELWCVLSIVAELLARL